MAKTEFEHIMFTRILQVPENRSFFLFGARGTGKSTYLQQHFSPQDVFWVDLLNPEFVQKFSLSPMLFYQEFLAWKKSRKDLREHWAIIDEIQKIPVLLDVVHKLIAEKAGLFVLTGSSARKLKRGAANLLAGRAFTRNLFPLTFHELKDEFSLEKVLSYGALPEVWQLKEKDVKEYLKTYVFTYIKEEIQTEQLVRNLRPFRQFIEICGQMNGKIINYAKIAKEIGVDPATVKEYFEILEDTMIGMKLESCETSVRKRIRKNPKFYLFDCGVARMMPQDLTGPITSKSALYGPLFEQFIILEIHRFIHYSQFDWELSYLMTANNVKIDLIIKRNGETTLLIEIKSKKLVTEDDIKNVSIFAKEMANSQALCLSNDRSHKIIQDVECMYWMDFFQNFILSREPYSY